ncbi:MAG: glycosyl hydrolase family 65 protein [Armatimonadota bacterium]
MALFSIYHAFLGIDSNQDGIIEICPAVPSQLSKVGISNVFYRGKHLKIEAGKDYVSLKGSKIPKADGLKLRITFRNAPAEAKVFVDGKAVPFKKSKNEIQIITSLQPVKIKVR